MVLTIQATTFTNHPNGEQTLGFRAYDEFGSSMYCNTMQSLPQDDLDFLADALVAAGDNTILQAMLRVAMHGDQVVINGKPYDLDEVEDIIAQSLR
jgi:hypothetical protein